MRIVKKAVVWEWKGSGKRQGMKMMNEEKNILVLGASGTVGNPDADRKTDEIRKTVIGTVKISRDLPYPCVPRPMAEERDGKIRRIVTASHRFRLHGSQTEDLVPVVYQSCMHPEQIRIYPVELEFTDGKITFRIRDRQWTIPENAAASVEISDWEAALEKKSCVPCTNCGKCSW